MECRKCSNNKFTKAGKSKDGRQFYECSNCHSRLLFDLKKRGRPHKSKGNCLICGDTMYARKLCRKHYRQLLAKEKIRLSETLKQKPHLKIKERGD